MNQILLRPGVLLALSAIISKLFGLTRDRLFISIFGEGEKVDIIFASFRIPDFFFYLLIGATVSTLLIPRITKLNENTEEPTEFFSSFLWGTAIFFGILCSAGILTAELLIPIFATGFTKAIQTEMLPLTQMLFGSVFILSISSVFTAFLQQKHRFISIALAPILYTGGICLTLFLLKNKFGLQTVGLAAILGATLHLITTSTNFFRTGNKIKFIWQKPISAWKNFKLDFLHRVFTNAASQINQTADVIIATFLLTGSVASFSLGSNLGHFLLSIVGISAANAAFPKLTKAQNNQKTQKEILKNSTKWILFFTIPTAIICSIFTTEILKIVFSLKGQMLQQTQTVFFWTIISLPPACLIPIYARFFLANDDTKTPLIINATSLTIATALAATLSIIILPPQTAILGLALGNFTANYLSATLFGIKVWKQ